MVRCDKDCLNCKLPKCIHDIEDTPKPFKPPKTRKPKKVARELVVQPKRGRPKKEREISYWDEWYAKNKERVKERSKARYQLKRDEILEKNREWRRNHKDYYKEWRRKKKEKEHECNGESESIIRES